MKKQVFGIDLSKDKIDFRLLECTNLKVQANGRTKTHYLRDRTLKAILIKAAGSAIQHDPQLKKYYNRKVDQGKHKLTVLNAVANKLVLRIFAVANRDEPFVKLIA